LLAGSTHSEDASVYQINEDIAIINTVDVFTPVVDDPYEYGQITAANSMSDVYAMGGRPVVAMNILAFHPGKFNAEIISEMLRGAQDKAKEAGCIISGGHSLQDTEIKYGLSVTGMVHPKKFWRNHTPNNGDVLILTKSLGTGCMSTALKHDRLDTADLHTITESMKVLNRIPVELLQHHFFEVHACTDITGYGLAGHLAEMMDQQPLSAEIELNNIPVFPKVKKYITKPAFLPGGFYANKLYNEKRVKLDDGLIEEQANIIYDPQTSGGLLIAMPENQAIKFVQMLKDEYPLAAAIIGRITTQNDYAIKVS